MEPTLHFIQHSCFLLETEQHALLFDYFDGDLPSVPPQKPLLVFASHFHSDHFSSKIFDIAHPNIYYILDSDIQKRRSIPPLQNITWLAAQEAATVAGVEIHTLQSNDEGVAFYLHCDGVEIYHAGDLNDWHWEGEREEINAQMAQHYHTQLTQLEGKCFDFAFLPTDPRLGDAYSLGVAGFLEHARAKAIVPMHTWGDFSISQKIQQQFPNETILNITQDNYICNRKEASV